MRFLFSPFGRSNRRGFWLFILNYAVLSFGSIELDQVLGKSGNDYDLGLVESVVELFLFWPSIAVSVRRLHDLGFSGWWLLWIYPISILVGIVAIVVASLVGVGVEAIDTVSPDDNFSEWPIILWIMVGAFIAPIAIQEFMLAFFPGQEGENRFDLGRTISRNHETPPWSGD